MNKKIFFALAATVSMVSINAYAQVPTTAQGERFSDRFKKEKLQPKSDAIFIEDRQQQADLKGADQIKLKLSSISISGNKVFSDEQLSGLYQGKLGQTVTLAEVYGIRDAITKKYREAGYIISRAVIPAQNFDKNSAHIDIRVIEGYVNSVSVQGEIKGNRRIIDRYISKIKQEGALNSNNLERYLLLLNDLSGTEATAVLKPARTGDAGGTDIIINMNHDKYEGVFTFDNSGTKFLGPYLMTAEGAVNSALGLSEQIKATVISDLDVNELKFGQLEYSQPIGYEGTKMRFAYGLTEANPGSTINPLGIEADTETITAELTHPFLRTRKENLSGRLTLESKDTDTDATAGALYHDKLRIATLGATFDKADSWQGTNLLDLSVSHGFDIMGATDANDLKSRANGDATFTRYNFEASRLQHLYKTWNLYVASQGQYANEGLLASEEFGFGGKDFGRGYDFSEITGDAGVAGKVELQYGIDAQYRYLSDVQAYTFYDIGRIWQKDSAGMGGEDRTTSAASAGLGVRFNLSKRVAAYTELAKPLTKDLSAEGDKDVRFNFGVSYLY